MTGAVGGVVWVGAAAPSSAGAQRGTGIGERHGQQLSACTTSFTSMVPITIFSLLTVRNAGPAGWVSRVSSTRLPLVSVLPANLEEGQAQSESALGPIFPQDQVPAAPVLVGSSTGDAAQVGGGRDPLHHGVVTATGFRQRELLSDLIHAGQLA